MTDADSTKTGWPVLRETITDRNILIYVLSLSAASTGIWAARIAIAWLAWELTKSPAWLSIFAFAALLPAAILAPIGGSIADKIGPIRALQLTQIGQLILSGIIFILAVTKVLTVELLLVYVLAKSVVASLGWSSFGGIMRALAPDRNLLAAVMWKDIVTGIGRIAGPALSAMVITKVGTEYVFLVIILGYLFFLFGLSKIVIDDRWTPNGTDGGKSIRTSFRQVMEFVRRRREIAYLVAFLALCLISTNEFPVKQLLVYDADSMESHALVKSIALALSIGSAIAAIFMIWLASRGTLNVLPKVLAPSFLIGAIAIFFLALPMHNRLVLGVIVSFAAGAYVLLPSVYVLLLTLVPRGILFTGMGVYHLIFVAVPALFVYILSSAVPDDAIYLRWLVAVIALLLLALWFWLRKRVPAISEALNATTSTSDR